MNRGILIIIFLKCVILVIFGSKLQSHTQSSLVVLPIIAQEMRIFSGSEKYEAKLIFMRKNHIESPVALRRTPGDMAPKRITALLCAFSRSDCAVALT